MCWKQEWAQTIQNLNSAIMHVERAQVKLHKRIERNEKHLRMLTRNKKYNYPSQLAPVQARIKKNREAEENCKDIILDFRKKQALLYCMIHTVGLWQKTKEGEKASRRTYTLMGNYPGKTVDCENTDCEECTLAQAQGLRQVQ